MREYLLPPTGQFYKANLHTHTTVSDGKMTPEEVKAAYKSRGYQIVAYTDHDVMVDHSDLSDSEFLALRGYEIAINDNRHGERWNHCTKTYHLSLIATTPEANRQVFFTNRYFLDWFDLQAMSKPMQTSSLAPLAWLLPKH